MTTFTLAQTGFIAVTIVSYGLFLGFLKQGLAATSFPEAKKRNIFLGTTGSIILWLVFTGVMAANGFFNDFSSLPPKFFIVVIVPLIVTILIARTSALKEILAHIAPEKIIGLQSFRIFVEVLLWMLFTINVVPEQMSMEGRNFDVIAGVTAIPVAWMWHKGIIGKSFVWWWNAVCLVLLINIVTISILSAPVPFRVFMNEPANTFVTQFPFVWLPGILVPLAYMLHVFSWIQLKGYTREQGVASMSK